MNKALRIREAVETLLAEHVKVIAMHNGGCQSTAHSALSFLVQSGKTIIGELYQPARFRARQRVKEVWLKQIRK